MQATRAKNLIILAFVPALLLASCGGQPPATPQGVQFEGTPEETPPASTGSPAGTAKGVLDFRAPNLAGREIAGNELAGQKLAIWFWAPW